MQCYDASTSYSLKCKIQSIEQQDSLLRKDLSAESIINLNSQWRSKIFSVNRDSRSHLGFKVIIESSVDTIQIRMNQMRHVRSTLCLKVNSYNVQFIQDYDVFTAQVPSHQLSNNGMLNSINILIWFHSEHKLNFKQIINSISLTTSTLDMPIDQEYIHGYSKPDQFNRSNKKAQMGCVLEEMAKSGQHTPTYCKTINQLGADHTALPVNSLNLLGLQLMECSTHISMNKSTTSVAPLLATDEKVLLTRLYKTDVHNFLIKQRENPLFPERFEQDLPVILDSFVSTVLKLKRNKTIHGDMWLKNQVLDQEEETLKVAAVKLIDMGHSRRQRLAEQHHSQDLITCHTTRAPQVSASFIVSVARRMGVCPLKQARQQLETNPQFQIVEAESLASDSLICSPLNLKQYDEFLKILSSQMSNDMLSQEVDSSSTKVMILDLAWLTGQRSKLVSQILEQSGLSKEMQYTQLMNCKNVSTVIQFLLFKGRYEHGIVHLENSAQNPQERVKIQESLLNQEIRLLFVSWTLNRISDDLVKSLQCNELINQGYIINEQMNKLK